MPTELRLYFQYVNGMSMRGGHDVDDNGFRAALKHGVNANRVFQWRWWYWDGKLEVPPEGAVKFRISEFQRGSSTVFAARQNSLWKGRKT